MVSSVTDGNDDFARKPQAYSILKALDIGLNEEKLYEESESIIKKIAERAETEGAKHELFKIVSGKGIYDNGEVKKQCLKTLHDGRFIILTCDGNGSVTARINDEGRRLLLFLMRLYSKYERESSTSDDGPAPSTNDYNDSLVNPYIYSILKPIDIGLKKEDIYNGMKGSKQTKVYYLNMLVDKRYVFVEKPGQHNTRIVKLMDKGRDQLAKMRPLFEDDNDVGLWSTHMDSQQPPEHEGAPTGSAVMNPYSDHTPIPTPESSGPLHLQRNTFSSTIDSTEYGKKIVGLKLQKLRAATTAFKDFDIDKDDLMKKTSVVKTELESFRNIICNDDSDRIIDESLTKLSVYESYNIDEHDKVTLISNLLTDVLSKLETVSVDGKMIIENMLSDVQLQLNGEAKDKIETIKVLFSLMFN